MYYLILTRFLVLYNLISSSLFSFRYSYFVIFFLMFLSCFVFLFNHANCYAFFSCNPFLYIYFYVPRCLSNFFKYVSLFFKVFLYCLSALQGTLFLICHSSPISMNLFPLFDIFLYILLHFVSF